VRVLLVANTLPPRDVSGVGEQVLQLAAGLRQQGVEVEVLGRGGATGVAGPKALFPLFAVPAVARALVRFRPDVVQVHESDGGLAALLVAWLAPSLQPRPLLVALLQVSYREERRAVRPLRWQGRVLGRPSAVERRFRLFKAPLQIALGWLTVRAADRVLAPSAATAAEIRRDYRVAAPGAYGSGRAAGADGSPGEAGAAGSDALAGGAGCAACDRSDVAPSADIAVVPNATGAVELAPRHAAATPPAPEPGFLLLVGRLRVRKGVDVLLAALPELAQDFPAVRLLIAGDGEHRATLERQAAALGLCAGGGDTAAPGARDRVTFLGRAGAAEVRALLQGAAALVVPSIYEGMPLVVLEAMDAAVPVVASRVSGIPEVVEDGRTGWLVAPEDPPALAAALAAVLADPAEARRRGLAGRRRLDEHFRPRHAARRWRCAVLGEAAREERGTP
jgi:glycosyltransferase involved in cell wall biosynthesis